MRKGYPITIDRTEERDRYIQALEKASTEGKIRCNRLANYISHGFKGM